MPTTKDYLIDILKAIAARNCSKDSPDKLFSHYEIQNIAKLNLEIINHGQYFKFSEKHKLLIKFYLSLLSEPAIGAAVRSNICANLVLILTQDTTHNTDNSINPNSLPPANEFEEDPGLENYHNIKNIVQTS